MYGELRTCGRPTRKGTPCVKGVSRANRSPQPDYFAAACGQHLTREERIVLAEEEAYEEARFWRAHSRPPACHTWPAPEEVSAPESELDTEDIRSSPELWEVLRLSHKMSKWQADRCAICGRQGAPAEDHCHRTGLFRGYLCRSCNQQEGTYDTLIFRQYRERPPAVIVGYTYRYRGFGTSPEGADPQQWVVEALGPVPGDRTQEALDYLVAAAKLPKPEVWVDLSVLGL
jgi:hypothetical protein